jgi:hypothetical protein
MKAKKTSKRTAAAANKAAPRKPSTKRVAPTKGAVAKRSVNKAELVRSLPGVPAKEVVAVMAKKGVKVTESYVYNVRAMARAAQKKAGSRGGMRATKKFSVPGGASHVIVEAMGGGGGGGGGGYTAPGPVTVEELLMAAAAEMGLSRAITLLYSAQTVITKALGVRA